MMKKFYIISLCLFLLLVGCKKEEKIEIVQDSYRNIYEIFVASFRDSNEDGVGDIKGITQKLDYIQDMGYTGIWLMPIHPSNSYHKYDVKDYYSIDESYGTLEDFDELIKEAHKRNIIILLDLVVNHTSSSHPWFMQAKMAYLNDQENPYISWYNFKDKGEQGYTKLAEGKYYESRFVDTMPDLNLNNQEVRKEIKNIMQFWFDRGVDGFRLDAVTSYATDNLQANITTLAWLNDMAKSIKEDCYLVGEAWTSDAQIEQYYGSGIDSFFQFSLAQADGTIAKCLKIDAPAQYYENALKNSIALTKGHIPAVFLDNHDMNRITGGIGRSKINQLKFVYGLAAMFNGTIYDYYGTEIGMVGSGKDENKRVAMLWGEEEALCKNPIGASGVEYVYPGVNEQEKDPSSLLNYHKAANWLRNQYPSIARGEVKVIEELRRKKLSVIEKKWEEERICILINFDEEEIQEVDLSSIGKIKEFNALLISEEEVKKEKEILTIPAYGIVVAKMIE